MKSCLLTMSEKLECVKVRTNSLASSSAAEIFTGDEAKIEKAKANTNKQIETLVAISTHSHSISRALFFIRNCVERTRHQHGRCLVSDLGFLLDARELDFHILASFKVDCPRGMIPLVSPCHSERFSKDSWDWSSFKKRIGWVCQHGMVADWDFICSTNDIMPRSPRFVIADVANDCMCFLGGREVTDYTGCIPQNLQFLKR